MGYTLLMQWTATCPPPKAAISDLIFSRLLEHYDLNFIYRTTIQIRTFKATFPTINASTSSSSVNHGSNNPSTRLLTTIIYSNPIYNNPLREPVTPQGVRDDTAYLFLEDRALVGSNNGQVNASGDGARDITVQGASDGRTGPKEGTMGNAAGSGLDVDGFEIVEPSELEDPTIAKTNNTIKEQEKKEEEDKQEKTGKEKNKYQALAVRPAGSVMSLLQNLGSQFVIGLTKSARAAASTTAQQPTATTLAGTSFLLSSITFHPLTPNQNPIILTIHNLPSPHSGCMIFEAEWEGKNDPKSAKNVLHEFLMGCIPEGLIGETKFFGWEGEENSESGGWEGIEKSRRAAYLLAKCLRESLYI